jgi:hypothetical protein
VLSNNIKEYLSWVTNQTTVTTNATIHYVKSQLQKLQKMKSYNVGTMVSLRYWREQGYKPIYKQYGSLVVLLNKSAYKRLKLKQGAIMKAYVSKQLRLIHLYAIQQGLTDKQACNKWAVNGLAVRFNKQFNYLYNN